MSKTYFIGCTHFYHHNIINYCNRPFKSVQEMNEALVGNWNKVVAANDIIYHLGDFSFGTFEQSKEVLSKLKGKKILIRGNHDRLSSQKFLEMGFEEVHKKLILNSIFYLSHRPDFKATDQGHVNIHAHIHNEPTNWLHPARFINVSAEAVNYTPIELREIGGCKNENSDL